MRKALISAASVAVLLAIVAGVASGQFGIFEQYEVVCESATVMQIVKAFSYPPAAFGIVFEPGGDYEMRLIRAWNGWQDDMNWDSPLNRGAVISFPSIWRLRAPSIVKEMPGLSQEIQKLSRPAKQPGEP